MPLPLLAVGAGALSTFLFAALRVFLIANLAGLVLRVLVAFGLNIVIVEPAIEAVMSIMTNQFGVLPQAAADWIGFFNLDRYVGLVLSAYAIVQTANFILKINR